MKDPWESVCYEDYTAIELEVGRIGLPAPTLQMRSNLSRITRSGNGSGDGRIGGRLEKGWNDPDKALEAKYRSSKFVKGVR